MGRTFWTDTELGFSNLSGVAGFTEPPPPADEGRYSLSFDGIDDGLQLPRIDELRGVSCWIWIDPVQPLAQQYLLDARPGTTSGFLSNMCVDPASPALQRGAPGGVAYLAEPSARICVVVATPRH